MKKVTLATWVALSMLSMNAFAEQQAYNGFSLGYVQSSLDGVSDSTSEVAIMRSVRANEHYGYEMQFGLFGNIGPYTTSGFLELSAAGFVPLGGNGFKLYGKAGAADTYSRGSAENANHFGLAYGAGVESPRDIGLIRVGLQHLTVGSSALSPTRNVNLLALTLLLK